VLAHTENSGFLGQSERSGSVDIRVRFPAPLIRAVDQLVGRQNQSRAEAIRALLNVGLKSEVGRAGDAS
jgi:metal-responsive CopG/Arc/MetJ family transcriptional regulator